MTFGETYIELHELKLQIIEIHDKFEGKANEKQRESLLAPLRKRCIELHYMQIQLNQQRKIK